MERNWVLMRLSEKHMSGPMSEMKWPFFLSHFLPSFEVFVFLFVGALFIAIVPGN